MRTHLYASLATLKMGLDILSKEEQVRITSVLGHGGLFKTEGVGQQILADAIGAPVSVMQGTAGEGGAYGIALLADYTVCKKDGQSLSDYLEQDLKKVHSEIDRTSVRCWARRSRRMCVRKCLTNCRHCPCSSSTTAVPVN